MANKGVILERDVTETSFLFPGEIETGCRYVISVTSVNDFGNSQTVAIPFIASSLTPENLRCIAKLNAYINDLNIQYKKTISTDLSRAKKIKKALSELFNLLDMITLAENTKQPIEKICEMANNLIIDKGYSF